jgi:glyoxylase I family protein
VSRDGHVNRRGPPDLPAGPLFGPMRPVSVLGLHHLALKARDPAGLAEFYASTFELTELKRHQDELGLRSVWLQLGEGILMIERADTPGPPPTDADPPGLHLLSLRIGADQHQTWRVRLGTLGIPIVRSSPYTLYLVDPEGNRLGLSSWPEPGQ